MKTYFLSICFAALILLSACSALPQVQPTPTPAPAPTSTPTPTPTPAPLPVSELDLASLLVQSGDLPAGFEPAQLFYDAGDLGEDIAYNRAVDQRLQKGGENAGGVVIMVILDENERQRAYQKIGEQMSEFVNQLVDVGSSADLPNNTPPEVVRKPVDGIGEQNEMILFHYELIGRTWKFSNLRFTRCNSVFQITFVGENSERSITAYGRRLDERFSPLVCQPLIP